jgi:CRP-like cAMP-binding protein
LAQNIGQYVKLTDDQFEYILSKGRRRKLKKNQSLLNEGDLSRSDFFVLKGCFRQYFVDDKGKEHVAQFALPGWWIGDWDSILNNRPSSYFIEALIPSEVIQFDYDELDHLFTKIPIFERYFRIIFQKAFAMQQRRIIWMQLPGKERYEEFLKSYRYFENLIPQSHIASYLGLSRESFNRLRRVSPRTKSKTR